MSQRRMFLEFDEGKRHPEGHVVLHLVAGPVSLGIKEPAGIAFHTTVLRQQGLLGASHATWRQGAGAGK